MRRLLVAAVVLLGVGLTPGGAQAQPGRMGEIWDVAPAATPPVIELFTFGRGALIFEKFGHTALCIDYAEPGRETVCFNYGVTDFDMDPGALTWAFIRGRQRFWVEPVPLGGMVAFYRAEDRTIERQALPLAPEEARAVERILIESLAPDRRYYLYDHFADNCTTRLRDILDRGTGGKLRAGTDARFGQTFRQMGMSGLAELPALIAFGDFAVGRTLDVDITRWDAMFHPFVLRDEVQQKFGVAPETVYARRGPPIPDRGPTGRLWSLLIGLAFALPLVVTKLTGRFERTTVTIAAVPLALVGLIIWTAAIVSTIPGLRWNEAVFLYVPFDAVYPFLRAERRRQYARLRVGMIVVGSLLRAVGLFLQPLWVPIVVGFALHGLIALELRNPPLARKRAS